MASGFLAPRTAAPVAPTAPTAPTPRTATVTEDTTFNVRGVASLMFWAGLIVVGVVPPVSAVMMVIGGVVWLLAPANAPATQAMVDNAGTPAGCGWGCAALGGVVGILFVAGALALAVGLMLVEVTP